METLTVVFAVLFVAASFALVWALLDRQRLASQRDLAQARLADEERTRDSFQTVASQVLRTSNEEFLRLAKESMASGRAETVAELERRKSGFDELVKPIQEALVRTNDELRRVGQGQTGLIEQVKHISSASSELRAETSKLSQALRKPNVRGRYGEIQLQRVVELAGMRSYCDFATQEALRDGDDRLQKPDLVVRLPNERCIAVDAKVPIEAYLEALDEEDPAKVDELLERYAQSVAEQARRLANKQYWKNFDRSPELVVMFIPGDQLVDAALERSPELVDRAAEHNVILASPSTLIGLLRAVHVGWRERNLTDSAEELFQLGKELHQRAAKVMERATRIGSSLEAARKSYNEFVGSVQSRLVPTLRRFEERGARSSNELAQTKEIDGEIRALPQGLFDLFDEPESPLPARKRKGRKPARSPEEGGEL